MGTTTDGRMSGDSFYLEFKSVALRGSSKGADVDFEGKSSDGTVLADEYETSIPTKKTLKISGDFVIFTKSTLGAQQRSLLYVHNEGNVLWGPEGNGTGKPKGGAVMRITKCSEKYKVGDTAVMAIEFEMAVGTGLLFDPKVDVWA